MRLLAPGRAPRGATITGLELVDGPGDVISVVLVLCVEAAALDESARDA